ncbi:MAG: hypothetical protein ACOYLQ_03840 [Hyphomicrobiaceae bacterium]
MEALFRFGVTCERLCVLAVDEHEDPRTETPAKQPELALEGLAPIILKPAGPRLTAQVLASPPKACAKNACDGACAIDPELVAGFPTWVMGRQARQLEDQLMIGGTLLFVRVNDDNEQTAVGRTLLRHARNGVQTHDFMAH